MLLITASQCRAARALLNWSQPDLAQKCDMHVQTISAFESENGTPTKTTLEKITTTFDQAGIDFLPQEGVRKKTKDISTYKGQAGFEAFMTDVFQTVLKSNQNVCVSNVDENLFSQRLGREPDEAYMLKMKNLRKTKNFEFKILIKYGDYNFVASEYADYRWVEARYFHSVPFYVYGNKLAFILFDKETTVYVIDNQEIANAQRTQFDLLWENAIVPPMK